MEPKKDFSTAILDQKKAPNKLIVLFYRKLRLKKLSTMKIHQSNYLNPRWPNLKSSRAMLSSLKVKRENKLSLLPSSIINSKKERSE